MPGVLESGNPSHKTIILIVFYGYSSEKEWRSIKLFILNYREPKFSPLVWLSCHSNISFKIYYISECIRQQRQNLPALHSSKLINIFSHSVYKILTIGHSVCVSFWSNHPLFLQMPGGLSASEWDWINTPFVVSTNEFQWLWLSVETECCWVLTSIRVIQ